MLIDGQEIIYKKNGQEITRVNSETFGSLSPSIVGYIRRTQPFVKIGDCLFIPLYDGMMIKTSKIVKIERGKNYLECETQNSSYRIIYKGINLEKVLNDSDIVRIDDSVEDTILAFP